MALWIISLVCLPGSAEAARKAKTEAAPKATVAEAETAPRYGDYLAGRAAQLDHDWRNAGQRMRQAWEADRDNLELRHDALLMSISGGDFAGAVSIAHAVASGSGAIGSGANGSADWPLANLILIVEDLAEGRYAAAQTKLAVVPAQGVDRYLIPLTMAWIEIGKGRGEAAKAALAPLDALDGATELHRLQAAMIAEARGDKAEADKQYDSLMEGKPSTRAIEAVAHFAERAGALEKARAAIEKLDPDGGSASLRAEMLARLDGKRKPLTAPSPQAGVADALFNIAASLATDEQQASLAPLLYIQLALHLSPNFPQAQLLLAELDKRAGRSDDAMAVLLSVDATAELRTTAVREALFLMVRADQGDAALKLGGAIVAEHPEDIDLALSFADLLREKSRFSEAIAVYDATLARIAPTSNRRGLALYHRGIAYQQAHEWPRAETDLLAALQLRPDDPGLLNYLAFSWADQGVNLDRARTMLERAIQLVPDDGAIVDSLGWVMFRAGDYAEAAKQLEHAVALDADDATVNDHLGDAYWRLGRLIEARSQWERAERLSDDKALTEQIRNKLRDGLGQGGEPRHASVN